MIEPGVRGDRMIYDYYWRVHCRFPERKGKFCRVIARGKRNNMLVEFEDGFRVITCRYFARKRKGKSK